MAIEIEIRTIKEVDYLIIDGKLCMSSGITQAVSFKDIVEELESMSYITIKVTEE